MEHLELRVGGGGHDGVGVEELDVGDGLAVVAQHGERAARRAQVVVVHAVVGRAERQVAGRARVEPHAAHVELPRSTRGRTLHTRTHTILYNHRAQQKETEGFSLG